ncbi:MAG: DUF47 family protein [Acholeplasmatales bacterium]|nr:DUF47 family protein [Acholeplasmatales bacterium]
MKKKEVNYYFQTFTNLFNFTIDAANYLEKVVLNFNGGITDEQRDEMHTIEHNADLCLHEALAKLAKEFITPIENSDILAIVKKIDDATDTIEDVLIKLYIRNVQKLTPYAKDFVNIIKRECEVLSTVLTEFPNFKKSSIIRDKIMEVLSIEEEGDKLYMSAIKELYQTENDPKELYIMEDVISSFEACCDIIEEIAQVIDEAVMKNI